MTNIGFWSFCRNEQIEEPPSDHRPVKLYPFIDSWIHGFIFHGESKPSAIFRCDQKVTTWAMSWKDMAGSTAVIVPHLSKDKRIHSPIGLSVVELQGFDNETAIMVVEERLPKSERIMTYGLILDLCKLSLEQCESLTARGYMFFPEDRTLWTPQHLQSQWDQIEEARADSAPAAPGPAQAPTDPAPPKKRGTKRKSALDTDGEIGVPVAGKPKKGKADEKLTLQQCVTMSTSDIEKLDKSKQTEMKNLYSEAFEPLYKWGHEKLKDDKDKEITVHYSKLHRAPPGTCVYRGLIEDRLKALTNQARIAPRYSGTDREITVLPLKKGPYGDKKTVEFFTSPPEKHQIKSSTNFYIIGGQHTVQCYRNLVESGEIDEADKAKASAFSIIPVWAPKTDHIKLLLLSRVLNQDMAGPQKEHTFMMQVLNARIKWKEMNCPKPSAQGRQHPQEFLVRLHSLPMDFALASENFP